MLNNMNGRFLAGARGLQLKWSITPALEVQSAILLSFNLACIKKNLCEQKHPFCFLQQLLDQNNKILVIQSQQLNYQKGILCKLNTFSCL